MDMSRIAELTKLRLELLEQLAELDKELKVLKNDFADEDTQALMTYEGAPNYRWVKMYKGVRYRVKCSEVPGVVGRTKEASLKAANEWWKRKLAELKHQQYRLRTICRLLVVS